jgi:hypothetical protein
MFVLFTAKPALVTTSIKFKKINYDVVMHAHF